MQLALPKNSRIAVIGLGYVGLPLAVSFARKFEVIGLDINEQRIDELARGLDRTGEIGSAELEKSNTSFTTKLEEIADADVYIVTVPTPITVARTPDLSPLISASQLVGKVLNAGNVVVYESTVYPGVTEEVCVPILEEQSGLSLGKDFGVGYSPERINPGDTEHRLESIVKITSGSSPEVAEYIDQLYASIIEAGTYRASSIMVAEAAKVIENSQRDINIAFVNELCSIFDLVGIDTLEVLDAAATKWNFLPFKPGLVGGHCIGVDPYYLTHKAQELGYHPEIILSGRRKNDSMSSEVVHRLFRSAVKKSGKQPKKVLILGLTFKENCPDLRNSKVFDVYQELRAFGVEPHVHDPFAYQDELSRIYGDAVVADGELEPGSYDGVIICVAHRTYSDWGVERIRKLAMNDGVLFDVKGMFPLEDVDGRL